MQQHDLVSKKAIRNETKNASEEAKSEFFKKLVDQAWH